MIGIGRDRGRRSITDAKVKDQRKQATRRRTRVPTGNAEEKYIGFRAGVSPKIWLNEVLDQQLKLHLRKEYRNEGETTATLKLTGYIESIKNQMRWKATREDMLRWFKLAEQSRWEKKFGLTKAEAVARFFTGHGTASIKTLRPSEFMAKRTTRYYPKPGSSAGRIITKQTGARWVQKDFESLIKTLFSLGDSFKKGKRAKMAKVSISRYISKE
jgi:hypothetical protein